MRNPIRLSHHLLLLTLALFSGACSSIDEAEQATTPERPNILFLFADDQRPDTIGALGNEHIRTPNIDRLVERGFAFRNNYCMGSIHGAVCQPSRAMLMSGRTLYRVPMDLVDVQTLPETLADQGYTTFGTGKWHNGADSFLASFQQGRNILVGGMSDHTKVPVQHKQADGTFTEQEISTTFSSELFANTVIEFLDQQKEASEPFFAYVAFTAPHDPRQPPHDYRQAYYDDRPPLPANFMPLHPFDNGRLTTRDEGLGAWPRTPEMVSDQLSEYYGLITHLDEQVGRILQALEDNGLAKDTIVVYTADHGLAVGSHGLLGKQNVYEHSMGSPLIIAGPGIPHGETRALTYILDLYPTLCGLAQAEVNDTVEGLDLSGIWRGLETSVRPTLYLTYEDKQRAVRDARFKLIRYPLIDHLQLFDLQDDPSELNNLAESPEHAERVQAMGLEMERWHEVLGDPHPLTVENPAPMEYDATSLERSVDQWQPQWIRDKYFE